MIVRVFILCLTAIVLTGCVTGSGRLQVSRSLSDAPYGYQLINAPVRAGDMAQRFEVRPGDCGEDPGWSDCDNDRERSEVTVQESFRPGAVRWLAYSIYLPSDFYSSPRVATTMGQIHQRGGPSGNARGLPSFPPLLQNEARGNRFSTCLHILSGPADNVRDTCREFQLATINEMRGRWTDFMIMLDTRGGGVLEIYVNGEPRVRTDNFIRFQPEEFYVKYGIYRSFVSRHGGPMPTQIAFYDEVRLGPDRASVEVSSERPVD